MKTSRQMKIKSLAELDVPPASEPKHEEIAALARSIWEQNGRPDGRDLENWLLAESQIRQQRASTRA
jgi:hypothetical protein